MLAVANSYFIGTFSDLCIGFLQAFSDLCIGSFARHPVYIFNRDWKFVNISKIPDIVECVT